MRWYLERIPRVAHFYWGHDYMPWVRWLTLKTFRHHNPDWGMVLWQPFEPVRVDMTDVPRGGYTPNYIDRMMSLRACGCRAVD